MEIFMNTLIHGTAYLINGLFFLAVYVVIAYALFCIAKNNNLNYAWLAFIPIAQYAIIGMLCEEYILFGVRIRPLSWIMVGLSLLQLILGSLLLPLQLIVNLFMALVLHKFFYLFQPRRALLYAILSMLGSIPLAVILFLIKDMPMTMSAAAYPYPFANRN